MEFGREMKKRLAFIGQPLYLLGRDDWIRTRDLYSNLSCGEEFLTESALIGYIVTFDEPD